MLPAAEHSSLERGGAVIPSLGLVEGGKLEYDHAFGRCTLKDFLAAIVCAGCDGVAAQRGRDISGRRINLTAKNRIGYATTEPHTDGALT
jgi:hypothetical protein